MFARVRAWLGAQPAPFAFRWFGPLPAVLFGITRFCTHTRPTHTAYFIVFGDGAFQLLKLKHVIGNQVDAQAAVPRVLNHHSKRASPEKVARYCATDKGRKKSIREVEQEGKKACDKAYHYRFFLTNEGGSHNPAQRHD